jgi:hypothetical protein
MKDKKMVLRFSRMAVKFFVPVDIFQQESSPTCFAKFWNLLRFTSIENTHIFLWPHPILESCHYVFLSRWHAVTEKEVFFGRGIS